MLLLEAWASPKVPARPPMNHRCVVARLQWLIEEPTSSPTAGLTCYRADLGPRDLFSVFVQFESAAHVAGPWEKAKIFALAEDMESRLPSKGEVLVLTAGERPVATAEIVSD